MPKDKKILEFKKYLAKDNPLTGPLYFGNINHDVDQGFELAIKTIEKKIAKAIDNESVIGQLWTKKGFNYKADLNDLHNSLILISKAQSKLDVIDAQNKDQENIPEVMKFKNTLPGYLEEADPDQSQRQGVLTMNLPEFSDDNIDNRMLQMADLLNL